MDHGHYNVVSPSNAADVTLGNTVLLILTTMWVLVPEPNLWVWAIFKMEVVLNIKKSDARVKIAINGLVIFT